MIEFLSRKYGKSGSLKKSFKILGEGKQVQIGQCKHTIDKGSGRTKRAKPVSDRQCHKDRAETKHVESSVTAIT
jgi:hypothetical protein